MPPTAHIRELEARAVVEKQAAPLLLTHRWCRNHCYSQRASVVQEPAEVKALLVRVEAASSEEQAPSVEVPSVNARGNQVREQGWGTSFWGIRPRPSIVVAAGAALSGHCESDTAT